MCPHLFRLRVLCRLALGGVAGGRSALDRMGGDDLLKALPATPPQRLPRSRATYSTLKPDASDLRPRGQRGAEQSERLGHHRNLPVTSR